MAAFGLVEKEYASIRGVAMERSAFGCARTFTLFKDAQLTRRARWGAGGGLGPQRGSCGGGGGHILPVMPPNLPGEAVVGASPPEPTR